MLPGGLESDQGHRDCCSLFTAAATHSLLPAKTSLILAALFSEALQLQQQLCYIGALNIYRLILRLPDGLVDPFLAFECYLFGAMCISGECAVPTWTKSCIRKLMYAKSMIEDAKLLSHSISSAAAYCVTFEDRLLDLTRVEIDIERKLSFVRENESFELDERNYPSFMHPSKRFYLSNRR